MTGVKRIEKTGSS